MNYYIQGDAANADKIKAAFEQLGYDISWPEGCANPDVINIGVERNGAKYVVAETAAYIRDIIKTHPDYKELELPVEPKFKVGDKVIYKGNVRTITFMDEVYYDFDGGVAGCRIEKQDELLSAAPKFKIGDWIACDADSFTLSIKSVRDVNYYFHQGESLPIKYIDEHYHLWSIADAKDGDVLAEESCIFIIKKLRAKCETIVYCSLHDDGEFAGGSGLYFDVNSTAPATSVQRNLLFSKMKEAGYTWDVDKKELRKIKPHYDIANFQPKQWVLVRQGDGCAWRLDIFSNLKEGTVCQFECVGNSMVQCIPFNDDTKHLLGTTDMCDEMYINW